MKKELSALEIGYLVKEFQCLINTKVDTVINPQKNDTFIDFFMPGKGKKILRILPNFIYFSEHKTKSENPTGFCMFLRKYLTNARVRKISQVHSERIIEFFLETKSQKYILIIELFSKGNIILCQENYWIIGLLESQVWKDRELKPGITYVKPPKKIDFYNLEEQEVKLIFQNDKTLVKKIAIDLGLSGTYAEEICLLTKFDKNKTRIEDRETRAILEKINELTNKDEKSFVVYKDEIFFDVVPFSLGIYDSLKQDQFEDYSSALDFVFKNNLIFSFEDEKTKSYEKKIEQLETTLKKQEEKIVELEETIIENEKKAELIYTNYAMIKDIIDQVKKASEKYSWTEIKEKLKDHKIIKEVNSKDKKLILELK